MLLARHSFMSEPVYSGPVYSFGRYALADGSCPLGHFLVVLAVVSSCHFPSPDRACVTTAVRLPATHRQRSTTGPRTSSGSGSRPSDGTPSTPADLSASTCVCSIDTTAAISRWAGTLTERRWCVPRARFITAGTPLSLPSTIRRCHSAASAVPACCLPLSAQRGFSYAHLRRSL